jgi:hypothetical protein
MCICVLWCSVVFREDEQTVAALEKELRESATQRIRQFGNHILVTGGNLYLYACTSHLKGLGKGGDTRCYERSQGKRLGHACLEWC